MIDAGIMHDELENLGLLLNILIPLALALGTGFVVEHVVRDKLLSAYRRSRVEYYRVLSESLRGMVVLWALLISMDYLVSTVLPLSPERALMLGKLVVIAGFLSVTLFFVNLTVGVVEIYVKKYRGAFPAASILKNVAKITILTLGLLVLMDTLGISITPVITALGIGGLAVALAMQDTLGNLFAGLHLVASGEIRIGDYVKLDSGEEGIVTDINWRTTTIKTVHDTLIVIPNSKLASSTLVNYHRPARPYLVSVDVGVSYDSDLDKVERVTLEVAREVLREVPGGDPYFEPYLRYKAFGDFSIQFSVYLRVQGYPLHIPLVHEFIKRLHRRYAEEGIEIPFPIRTVYLRERS